ncbi:hypothetical protein [Caballeronia glathei]|uniref:Uncharacterized protein n=1 Tax=Caballeronia glathei TaxID=60547 RepID=A0A069PHR3_9BURK|nr:hypothetical protein [Caballeronia glathei]KDR39902.1 hypothetical protein BG61_29585 [Caballeronia glathei]
MFFFTSSLPGEGQIFDLVDTAIDERVGLLAPVRALASREHSRSDDEYFQTVAASAFWQLVEDKERHSQESTILDIATYSISDFYDENLSVLIVNPLMQPTFNLNAYVPGLFSYGYSVYTPGRPMSCSFDFKDLPKGKSLKLAPVWRDYVIEPYFKNLYTEILPYEINPIATFLLQYQVFEVLMQAVFAERLQQLKEAVGKFSGTASDLRELVTPIQELSAERDRIRTSISAASVPAELLHDICDACKALLAGANKAWKSEQCGDLLYDVRNLIFHNFRAIPNSDRQLITKINGGLVRALPRLLSRLA